MKKTICLCTVGAHSGGREERRPYGAGEPKKENKNRTRSLTSGVDFVVVGLSYTSVNFPLKYTQNGCVGKVNKVAMM